MKNSLDNLLTGLRQGWGLAKPYFASEEKWPALGLLVSIVLLNLLLTELNVEFTYWQRDFYNALQDKKFSDFVTLLFAFRIDPQFPYLIIGFVEYAGIFIVIAVYALYLNQMLQIRWRQWLTRDFTNRWLSDHAFYNISLAKTGAVGIDNPDQRIANDLAEFTSNSLSLALDLMSNIVTLISFVTVLFFISGSITLFGITIPGYMLWLAILYSIFGTWITHKIGKPLLNLSFQQQVYEANFRYSLIRVRDNPEAIALSSGEPDELISLGQRFKDLRDNWWAIMKRTKLLGFFTNGFSVVSNIFPIAAAAPRYFSGAIQLGGLIQIGTVFSQVQGPLSWIVSQYTSLVSLRATISRLHGFKEAVVAARLASAEGPRLANPGDALVLKNLTLSLPDGRKLIENANLTLQPGEPILLTGPSGTGKSTLFRAIAGIWPHGGGEVSQPKGSILFLPQRPYFPLGSLQRAITYPGQQSDYSDENLADALHAVGLEALSHKLHDEENWGQILSGGEQQRLAIARALIVKPDWLFLDEATSALDQPQAISIFTALREHLPQTTIVAISHGEAPAQKARHYALGGGALSLAN